jgi:bis(5'-nucleosidyl)-tetraphosphatase
MMNRNRQPGFQRFLGIPVAYEVSVGAVIMRKASEGREYLLLQYRHGHWDFVKGHGEAGETHEETLRREAKEEADIDSLTVFPGFREKTSYFYVAKGGEREKRLRLKKGLWIFKKVYWYLAETQDTEVFVPRASHEHLDYAWLPFEGAVARATHPAAKRILQSAEEFMKKKEGK